jgi:hypothetical protein
MSVVNAREEVPDDHPRDEPHAASISGNSRRENFD